MSKITLATLKAFIRKNKDHLLIEVRSKFDGMTDCIESCERWLNKALFGATDESYTLGIHGVYVVRGARNSISQFSDLRKGVSGFHVSNCCGSFRLAVKNEQEPIRTLSCCVCGALTTGRQWFNRDLWFGICPDCATAQAKAISAEEHRSLYGEPGVNFIFAEAV